MSNIVIPRLDDKCALCRNEKADQTGSHMVPNLLTAVAFSFDGKSKRDREIVELYNLSDHTKDSVYYGREVSQEKYMSDLGHAMTDEEFEANTNVLVRDNIFCKGCEKRFSVVETAYGDYYKGIKKDVNPRVAYLFWLSVVWRMSIGYMAIFLDAKDELAMRDILYKNLKTYKEMVSSTENLGDFGYILCKCEEPLRRGDSGAFGTRSPKSPYVILVADYVLILFNNYSKLPQKVEVMGFEFFKEDMNTCSSPIIEVPISRKDFYEFRKAILDEHYTAFTPMQEKMATTIREKERHTGKAMAKRQFWEAMKAAKLVETISGGNIRYNFHQGYRFKIAYLKMIRQRELGIEYDFLKDEIFMLTEKDFERYKNDIIKAKHDGIDVRSLPFAKEILGDETMVSYEEMLNEFFKSKPEEFRETFWKSLEQEWNNIPIIKKVSLVSR